MEQAQRPHHGFYVRVGVGGLRHGDRPRDRASRGVVWDMGDGTKITCRRLGTPDRKAYGAQEPPDCGHRYTCMSTSEPTGRFALTATTTWALKWAGAGQTGTLTAIRDFETSVEIHEVQVVN